MSTLITIVLIIIIVTIFANNKSPTVKKSNISNSNISNPNVNSSHKFSDSDKMLERIERTMSWFRFEEPYIDIYFAYKNNKANLIIKVFFSAYNYKHGGITCNPDFINERLFYDWKLTYNDDQPILICDFWNSSEKLISYYVFEQYVAYIRNELIKKYPQKLFEKQYKKDNIIGVLEGGIRKSDIPPLI